MRTSTTINVFKTAIKVYFDLRYRSNQTFQKKGLLSKFFDHFKNPTEEALYYSHRSNGNGKLSKRLLEQELEDSWEEENEDSWDEFLTTEEEWS